MKEVLCDYHCVVCGSNVVARVAPPVNKTPVSEIVFGPLPSQFYPKAKEEIQGFHCVKCKIEYYLQGTVYAQGVSKKLYEQENEERRV